MKRSQRSERRCKRAEGVQWLGMDDSGGVVDMTGADGGWMQGQ